MSSEVPISVNLDLVLFVLLLMDVRVRLKSVGVKESLAIYFKRLFNEVFLSISQEAQSTKPNNQLSH